VIGMGMNWGGGGGGGGHNRYQMRELAKNETFDWPIIRRALTSLIPYWPKALLVTGLLLLAAVGGVLPAYYTRDIIDGGIEQHNLHLVIVLTIALIVTAVLTGLVGVWQTWLTNIIAQSVMADYRLALFRHIQRQSVGFFATRKSGDLVSRVMNDVTAIQSVISTTLVGLLSNVLVISSTLVLMFSMNWQLTILSLVVVPGFVIPTQRVGRVRQGLQGHIQDRLSRLTVHLSEQFGVSGALLTRIFGREREETARFSEVNLDLRDLEVKRTLVGRWLMMWMSMFSSVGPALLWGYGGYLAITGHMQLGTIVAFTALLGRLYGPLSQFAQLQVSILSSIALFRRIYAILDVEPDVQDGPDDVPAAPVSPASGPTGDERTTQLGAPRLEVRDLSFAYPPQPGREARLVLDRINLVAPPGHMIALVGPSGAGKTTLMNLLPRFADPTSGAILLDGIDIRRFRLASLRAQMGLVPQDPFFFHDTVRNNLLFARTDATHEDLVEACRAAQILSTIEALPDGFDTVVGERGHRLSGGERQRLAIARVLLRGPRIVLLDEATSALDTLVEREIQEALSVLLNGRTAIVIAHRLSTILSADTIAVLDGGRIVAQGRHVDLLEQSPLYRELYEAQFETGINLTGTFSADGLATEPPAFVVAAGDALDRDDILAQDDTLDDAAHATREVATSTGE
jgi:ATP-binding cassette subfamily B protein